MLLQMLLQVYYGQDDNGSTLPYLVGCVFIYFAYKWIRSTRNNSSLNNVRESDKQPHKDDDKSDTSIEQLLSHTKDETDVSNGFDETKKKAEAKARLKSRFSGIAERVIADSKNLESSKKGDDNDFEKGTDDIL